MFGRWEWDGAPLLTNAASAFWRPSHASAGIPMQCSPPLIWKLDHRATGSRISSGERGGGASCSSPASTDLFLNLIAPQVDVGEDAVAQQHCGHALRTRRCEEIVGHAQSMHRAVQLKGAAQCSHPPVRDVAIVEIERAQRRIVWEC